MSAGLLAAQVRLQDVGEQVVVPVPVALVVQRHQEEVRALQPLEHRPAAAPLEDGVAQVAAEHVEDRCPFQEVADLVGLAGEHLVGEVVHDVAIGPGEALR